MKKPEVENISAKSENNQIVRLENASDEEFISNDDYDVVNKEEEAKKDKTIKVITQFSVICLFLKLFSNLKSLHLPAG